MAALLLASAAPRVLRGDPPATLPDSVSPARIFDEAIDSPMYSDPKHPMPSVTIVYPEVNALWTKALASPEMDVRRQAANAVVKARRGGLKGLEALAPVLRAALEKPDQHPTVRVAAARALVELDARESAPILLEQARTADQDYRDVVEPALARWDFQPARAVWLSRLQEPVRTDRAFVLAIQGLGAVKEARANDRLLEISLSLRFADSIRLEAARALGSSRSDGLETEAQRLAEDSSPRRLFHHLAAASLLQSHKSDAARGILVGLAQGPEPSVAAIAIARLIEIDVQRVATLLERLLAHQDAKLRELAVETLFRLPTEQNIKLLADRLDDVSPSVRRGARGRLKTLAARPELAPLVIREAGRQLSANSWRGQEQAILLLALLDHKPSASRMVALLRAKRPEVYVSAAWAMRKLDVPETLDDAMRFSGAAHKKLRAELRQGDTSIDPIDHQLSQLNQFLGRRKYAPADAVLRAFIPRMGGMCGESRGAAIWALARIHAGKYDAALAKQLEDRLNDLSPIPPSEDVRVRLMSAMALGQIQAKSALGSLRKNYPEGELCMDPVNNACGWAIERLTGEPIKLGLPIHRRQGADWFLLPLEKTDGNTYQVAPPNRQRSGN